MPVAPAVPLVLLLAAAGRAAPARRSTDGSLSGVVQKWKEYQLQCLKYLYEAPPIAAEGKFCNRTFDNYACWPDGLPGTYVNVSCPWYLPWANTDILRPLCPFRFVCIQRFLTGPSQDKPMENGSAFLLC